jgi:hypothetical protein
VGVDASTVDGLVDAYQRSIDRARTQFGTGPETRVVVAAVVENARAARHRLVTSVAGGDRATGRLDTFLAAAEQDDVLGKLFTKARSYATSAAKSATTWAAKQAAGVSAGPSFAAIVGGVLVVAGFIHDIGRGIGAILALVLTAALAIFMRNPGMGSRVLVAGAQTMPGAMQSGYEWTADTFTKALTTVDRLGRGATTILDETIAEPSRRFFGPGASYPGAGVASLTRNAAKTVLYGATPHRHLWRSHGHRPRQRVLRGTGEPEPDDLDTDRNHSVHHPGERPVLR